MSSHERAPADSRGGRPRIPTPGRRPRGAAPHGAAPTCAAPRLRTYVLVAVGDSAGLTEFARPLGTLAAATRQLARAAAGVLFADVARADLRAVAAGSAPPGYLVRALALDGERLLGALEGAA